MGVPAFFRWLSRKYASIVVHCVEEKGRQVDGVSLPVDASHPNPNDIEFDNLYLDMNGIIHPCCHPENKPAPKNEDEMMVDIFAYIDRLFSIVRPRKLLYMAIDGVAPRAKMNQQRSRRFRAAKESIEKREDIARIKGELRAKGAHVPPDKPASEHFDSNCITPGTPFMFRLAECLRFYIHDRLNNDPGWKNVKVILSDANVPGEGEHKIMDYIRRQRAQPDHDPNTHHCLCGADADLIMLGLATHEPNFTIIREEFKPNQPRNCEICNQPGHEMKECTGLPKEKQGEFDELPALMGEEQQFIFLRLNVLREYLERELSMPNLPFKQDLERAIDDWVLMCFFVGNDFLPHLPSLEIREGAIDRLVRLYKKAVYKTGGYLTENGYVNLERVQLVLSDLGEVEDEIFKKRRETELDFRRRDKEKRKRARQFGQARAPKFMLGGQYAPQAVGAGSRAIQNPRQTAADMRVQAMNYSTGGASNQDAAAALRSMLTNEAEQDRKGVKRKSEEVDSDEEPEPPDEVKLWEDGWKDRYYESKFAVDTDDIEFRHRVANEYVLGLCWVLRYYYQGCPSWKWYFPFHYAPFASDFVNIGDLDCDFEKNTEPFKPLEQLMGVFPAASKQFLPFTWQDLMDNPESPIIDFYPSDFKIDLNGKKYAWQGVALLPFVDEKRLLGALSNVYPDLNKDEKFRNVRGNDRLFVSGFHSAHDFLEGLYESGGTHEGIDVNTALTQGMKGGVWSDNFAVMSGEVVKSPLESLRDIPDNRAISVQFRDPQYDSNYIFPAVILKGAVFPGRVLKPQDFEAMEEFTRTNGRGRGRGRGRGGFGSSQQSYRPQLGFTRDSGYRGRNTYDPTVANRMLRGSMGGGSNSYGSVPPQYGNGQQRGGGRYGGSQGYSRGGRDDNQQRGGSYGGYQQSNQGGFYSGASSRSQPSHGYSQGGGRYGQGGGGGGGYSRGGPPHHGYQGRGGPSNQFGGYNPHHGNGRSGYGSGGGGGGQGYGMLSEGDGYQGGYGGSGRRSYPQPPPRRR